MNADVPFSQLFVGLAIDTVIGGPGAHYRSEPEVTITIRIPHPQPVYDDALEADLEDYITGCNGCPECRLVCPQSKVEAPTEYQTFAEDEHIPGSFEVDAAAGPGLYMPESLPVNEEHPCPGIHAEDKNQNM